jgi:hypothetical protein
MKKIFYSICCLIILCALPVVGQETVEDIIELQVIGEALIINDNLPVAKELAISDGLNKAVEQTVGALVYSETQVENYQLIKDSIRLRSAGYVTGYEEIKTWTEQEIVKVLLTVTVRKGSILKDLDELGFILRRAGDPRIMVLVSENTLSKKRIPVRSGETEIINGLVQAGYKVLNCNETSRAQINETYLLATRREPKLFQRLAAEYGVDLLVLGQASTVLLGSYQGLISCRALMETKVVKANTGEILTVHEEQDTGVDLTEITASEKALLKVAKKLVASLLEDLPSKLAVVNVITLDIENISYADLLLAQKNLQEIHLVSRVNLREFASKKATLTVETTLLASQLAGYIAQWQDFSVEITRVSMDKIELVRK